MSRNQYRIPAEPIRHLLRSWLDVIELTTLATVIFPEIEHTDKAEHKKAKDKLLKVLNPNRVKTLDFDFADKILCRLDQVELWNEDPVLKAAYEAIDFKALDRERPCAT